MSISTVSAIETVPVADNGAAEPEDRAVLVALRDVTKIYGTTIANDAVSLPIRRGDVIGLVGANGAGKSTAMRILCGNAAPEKGRVEFGGIPVDQARYGPIEAHRRGVRIVHQELSLCPNLTVSENFYLEQPQHVRLRPFWLSSYQRLAEESIERIFPGAGIDVSARVGALSIGHRQMVEIARAASTPGLSVLVLDEPTSSLDAERAAELQTYVRERACEGLAVVFISHKLREVLAVSDRVVAMRNGRIVWEERSDRASMAALVEAMGGVGTMAAEEAQTRSAPRLDAPVLATIDGAVTKPLGRPVSLHAGEIVGIAGLEGSGQKALLRTFFDVRSEGKSGHPDGITRRRPASFVSGDRQREGVFPLWSVIENISIGRSASQIAATPIAEAPQQAIIRKWTDRLALDPDRFSSGILDLSGGNQQKALLARAMVSDSDIVLLDDPTRGVDIAAKKDFYDLLGEIAGREKLVLWYSTEDTEFLQCDRVLVFSRGRIVAELTGDEISEDAIVSAAFAAEEAGSRSGEGVRDRWPARLRVETLFTALPFASLLFVFGLMTMMNPLVASVFGLELLLAPAVVLVLVALAQMFVVGGSEIDLSVGAFAGLINVVSATLLVSQPLVGALGLAGGLVGYAVMALLIQKRAIPAIVMTLGASFIWLGLGQTLQPSPGGASPAWLSELVRWSIPGIPTPLVLIAIAGLVAFVIDRSPAGVVMRGFGSSPQGLTRSGWSPLRFAILRYVIAGAFAGSAGLYLTATNGASDINAGNALTLLAVAAVVIGGCELFGGVIAPLGVVAGAITLSLIGALLAFLGVATDFNALVQGALLIGILGLRTIVYWRRT